MGPQWSKDSLVLHPLTLLRGSLSTNYLLSLLLFALPLWISSSILIMCTPESFLFYPFSCVCAFHCVGVHSTCVYMCLWKPEVDSSSLILPTYSRRQAQSIKPRAHWCSLFHRPTCYGDPLFLAPEAGITDDLLCPLIYMGSGIPILVLTFAQQVCTCLDICSALKYYF